MVRPDKTKAHPRDGLAAGVAPAKMVPRGGVKKRR
jgi:hypothetical protein